MSGNGRIFPGWASGRKTAAGPGFPGTVKPSREAWSSAFPHFPSPGERWSSGASYSACQPTAGWRHGAACKRNIGLRRIRPRLSPKRSTGPANPKPFLPASSLPLLLPLNWMKWMNWTALTSVLAHWAQTSAATCPIGSFSDRFREPSPDRQLF